MKGLRIASLLIMILWMGLSGGCKPLVYFYSFAVEGDLGEGDEAWASTDGEISFFAGGVRLHDVIITCPYMFRGNFTETIEFNLNVNNANRMYFAFVLGDGEYDPLSVSGDNHFPIEFDKIGADPSTEERITITDHDAFPSLIVHHNPIEGPVPGLVRTEDNTLVLQKTGNDVTITINGEPIDELELTYYDSDWFCPNIYVRPYFSAFDYYIEITSVQIEYNSGNIMHL